MKRGLTYHLAVAFDGVCLDDVEHVEIIFTDSRNGPPLKRAEWPGNVIRRDGSNVLLVPWTADETWRFAGDTYMDTRITLRGTTDQPTTPIVALYMSDTLFEEGRP